MNILKRTLVGLLVVFLAFGQVTVIPGDWVQGFSSLTTAGSNVYVTGAGTIGQDTSFTRSAAGRYTLYDATATTGVTTLTVRAGAGQSTTVLQSWRQSNNTEFAYADPTNGSMNAFAFRIGNGSQGIYTSSGTVYPSTSNVLWSTTTNAATGSYDLGLTRASVNNLAVTNGGATNYWLLGAGGIQCGSGDGNSAACDVGTTGARVRNVNAAGTGTFANVVSNGAVAVGTTSPLYWNTRSQISAPADSRVLLTNFAGDNFDRIQFGGTTSSFVAAKRFGNALAIRAADDTVPTFATLTTCAAGGEGALSPVSDSITAVWGATITGGGTDHVLAYCNGTNWTVAAK